MLNTISLMDIIAAAWFLLSWIGYAHLSNRTSVMGDNVMTRMDYFRVRWIEQTFLRENRVVDAQIIANIQRSTSFFCQTTILIIAGLLAVLGSTDIAMEVMLNFPFAVQTSPLLWQIKVMLLIFVFVYSFFKHTWALRQLNYCAILIGSIPIVEQNTQIQFNFVHRIARISSMVAKHFNHGVRAYYFGLAAMTWFIHPVALIAASVWVILVLHRREFKSNLVKVLGLSPEEANTKN